MLHADQGLGDTLQFVRYVKLVRELGANVYLEVQAELRRLLVDYPDVTEVFSLGSHLPAIDYHCPLGSLPFEFQTNLATIPIRNAYLRSLGDRSEHWKELMGVPGTKPRVGVVWSGGTQHKNDRNRSIPLKTMTPLFDDSSHFYSLQKEIRKEDSSTFARLSGITNLAPYLHDFLDTAAAISNLDLVISADTSVAHLAGALGKRVWILVPYNPDFRWLVGRTDSPWYPSARLFRQPALGDWESVIEAVRNALSADFGAYRRI